MTEARSASSSATGSPARRRACGRGPTTLRRRATPCDCRGFPGMAARGKRRTGPAGRSGTARSNRPLTSSRHGATSSSPAACRWEARWSPVWPSRRAMRSRGWSWSIRPSARGRRLRSSRPMSAGRCALVLPSAATSRSRASRSRRTTARRSSPVRPWGCSEGRPGRIRPHHRADAHVPQHRGPRRRRPVGDLLKTGATSTEVEEILLENSYHVATLDYDAEQIFAGSVEFFEQLTAEHTT